METGAGDRPGSSNKIAVTVKFSGRSIPITLSPDSTVKDLKSLLQPLTNVLPRGQKLISKGRVLLDSATFSSSDVQNGAKIMLMASQGLHQGDGPIKKESPASSRRIPEGNRGNKVVKDVAVEKSQLDRWKATGVVALSQSDLKAIPQEVWNCGPSVRVLDLSCNFLLDLPVAVGGLTSLQKLLLNSNCLTDESICWEGILSLRSLSVLSLSSNQLTALPSAFGALSCLKQLHLASNKLTCLPSDIGKLTQLQVLEVNNNRISAIPTCIGNCAALVEVDFSSNLLVELPETLGNLHNLKALHLDNNGLRSLPSMLLQNCKQLSTLDLHGTEITMDILRQFEGWESFDERRRLKHQKQLAFRVEGSAYFDEGADKS